jgi:hypothetical protein
MNLLCSSGSLHSVYAPDEENADISELKILTTNLMNFPPHGFIAPYSLFGCQMIER